MKIREVLLDFTPLLDVTLILLFFFLLFTTFEVEEAKATLEAQTTIVEEQQAEAAHRLDQAKAKFAEADALTLQLEDALEIAKNANNRDAANASAIIAFNQGQNLKLILSDNNGVLVLKYINGEDCLGETMIGDDLLSITQEILSSAGYKKDDTILCEFVFDGSMPGTNTAYRKIAKVFEYIKKEYPSCYISETDICIVEE